MSGLGGTKLTLYLSNPSGCTDALNLPEDSPITVAVIFPSPASKVFTSNVMGDSTSPINSHFTLSGSPISATEISMGDEESSSPFHLT